MSDTFCVLPWFGREISWNKSRTHCCLLPKNYDIEKIKSSMLRGERPVECQKCWRLEENGIKSDRQVKNAELDYYMDRDLEFIKQDAISEKNNDTLMLKLFTSYTCNGTCVSCNQNFSSSWYQLNNKTFNIVPEKNYKFIDFNVDLGDINFKKLISLSLLGGEPLYEKKNFDLLEHILDIGNNKVFISIVTNGSVSLTDRQKTILSKFKNLNFSISIDGTKKVFEYLRYPLKWDQLIQNIEFFQGITDNISSNYTISNLNIFYHTDTVKWFNQQNIIFSKSPVYHPAWLQPSALPIEVKNYLKTSLSDSDYNTFIGNNHSDQDQLNFKTFLNEIKQQDNAKGINLKDYLPELAQMINWS